MFDDDEYIFAHHDNIKTAVARNVYIDCPNLTDEEKSRLLRYSYLLPIGEVKTKGLGFFAEVPGTSQYVLMATDRFWDFYNDNLLIELGGSEITVEHLLNQLVLSASYQSNVYDLFADSPVSQSQLVRDVLAC
jgi:hypothetical protein